MKPINFGLNVIWLLFCGIWMAIGYVVAGIICCVLIVTIPFGIAPATAVAYIRAARSRNSCGTSSGRPWPQVLS